MIDPVQGRSSGTRRPTAQDSLDAALRGASLDGRDRQFLSKLVQWDKRNAAARMVRMPSRGTKRVMPNYRSFQGGAYRITSRPDPPAAGRYIGALLFCSAAPALRARRSCVFNQFARHGGRYSGQNQILEQPAGPHFALCAMTSANTLHMGPWTKPFDAKTSSPRRLKGFPIRSETRPPASSTSSEPAALSHGFSFNSQKPSKRPAATEQRSSAAEPARRIPCESWVNRK